MSIPCGSCFDWTQVVEYSARQGSLPLALVGGLPQSVPIELMSRGTARYFPETKVQGLPVTFYKSAPQIAFCDKDGRIVDCLRSGETLLNFLTSASIEANEQ